MTNMKTHHSERELQQHEQGQRREDDIACKRVWIHRRSSRKAREPNQDRDRDPQSTVQAVEDSDASHKLQLLVVPHVQYLAQKSMLPGIELDASDVREQFAHQPRALVAVLHLLLLHLLEEACDESVQRDREKHDRYADEGRPTQKIVERYKGECDLPGSRDGDESIGAYILKTGSVDGHEVDDVASALTTAIVG